MQIEDEINHLFQQAVYANSNKGKSFYKKFFPFILVAALFFIMGWGTHFLVLNKKESPIFKENTSLSTQTSPIFSKKDKRTFKKLVYQVAQKEKKHPNKIHQELRERFNYKSYHYLTKQLYQQIVPYLKERLK